MPPITPLASGEPSPWETEDKGPLLSAKSICQSEKAKVNVERVREKCDCETDEREGAGG